MLGSYQSSDWGGSSLALEVLTVSTHPIRQKEECQLLLNRVTDKSLRIQLLGSLRSNGPGIGNLPCLFRKAEYALMNFCAYVIRCISTISVPK